MNKRIPIKQCNGFKHRKLKKSPFKNFKTYSRTLCSEEWCSVINFGFGKCVSDAFFKYKSKIKLIFKFHGIFFCNSTFKSFNLRIISIQKARYHNWQIYSLHHEICFVMQEESTSGNSRVNCVTFSRYLTNLSFAYDNVLLWRFCIFQDDCKQRITSRSTSNVISNFHNILKF